MVAGGSAGDVEGKKCVCAVALTTRHGDDGLTVLALESSQSKSSIALLQTITKNEGKRVYLATRIGLNYMIQDRRSVH